MILLSIIEVKTFGVFPWGFPDKLTEEIKKYIKISKIYVAMNFQQLFLKTDKQLEINKF